MRFYSLGTLKDAIGEDYEDLQQDARIRIWRAYELVETPPYTIKYKKLYNKTLYNLCLNHLVKHSRRKYGGNLLKNVPIDQLPRVDEHEFFSTNTDLRAEIRLDVKRVCSKHWNEEDTAIIQQFLTGSLAVKEIEKVKGWSHGKTERWLSEARETLRGGLKAYNKNGV